MKAPDTAAVGAAAGAAGATLRWVYEKWSSARTSARRLPMDELSVAAAAARAISDAAAALIVPLHQQFSDAQTEARSLRERVAQLEADNATCKRAVAHLEEVVRRWEAQK